MGGETSSCEPSEILNLSARDFFEKIIKTIETSPDTIKKNKNMPKLIKIIFDSLKNVPTSEKEFGFVVTGPQMGPLFVESILPKIQIPQSLTKISLRKSSLKPNHAKAVVELIGKAKHLKQFDASENDFGENGNIIISVESDLED